ncbi:MAG: alpha/beta hydrolase fold domain-containing protein [Acidimicrobiales bacterium]
MPEHTPVPYDPEIAARMAANPMPDAGAGPRSDEDRLAMSRRMLDSMARPMDEVIAGRPVEYEERKIAGPKGDVEITIIRPKAEVFGAPGIYDMHPGGLVSGSRYTSVASLVDWAHRFGFVGVTVEYGRAPENPNLGPAQDSYAGLLWMAENAKDLGVDPGRIMVGGASAGGNLAASMALMARDNDGPPLLAQMLLTPMLDDRNITASSYQYDGFGPWDRQTNIWAWRQVLGAEAGGGTVSPYVAPARATDLSGLPPAYIDVGSAEVFRDESVAYATGIWASGGEAELHVWSGGCHAFYGFYADTAIARAANAARDTWLTRILAR